MRKLFLLLTTALVAFGAAGSASAALLNWEGTSILLLGDFPPGTFTGGGVVDDIANIDLFVLRTQPGFDPEGSDTHQFLLLRAHRTRHVHHVDDDRIRLGDLGFFPGTVAHILADGHYNRLGRIVFAGHDLAFERFAVGALEVAQ